MAPKSTLQRREGAVYDNIIYLSPLRERQILDILMRNPHDVSARNEFVVAYIPLVTRYIGMNWRRLGITSPDEYEDYVQEGILGLFRAIGKYDSRIAGFSTYAQNWVRNFLEEKHLDDLPLRPINRSHMHGINRSVRILRNLLGREPSPEEIAKHAHAPLVTVVNEMRRRNTVFHSLDAVVSETLGRTFGEYVPDTRSLDPERCVIAKQELEGCVAYVAATTAFLQRTLSARNVEIVQRLCGLPPYYDAEPIHKVARAYGVTPSRVRQIFKRAFSRNERYTLPRLKQALEAIEMLPEALEDVDA